MDDTDSALPVIGISKAMNLHAVYSPEQLDAIKHNLPAKIITRASNDDSGAHDRRVGE